MAQAEFAKRVLVVDDDPSFVTFARAAIGTLGLLVEVSFNGSDALRRLAQGLWSGVLLDLKLPDIHGVEVLQRLRERRDFVPVLVLSGAASIEAAVEATKLGAVDVMEKPIPLAKLRAAVLRLASLPSSCAPTGPTGGSGDHCVDRLAHAILAVASSEVDVPNVRAWCARLGTSESSWYALCAHVGVRAKSVLDLARLLRAYRTSDGDNPRASFAVADPRTTSALLQRAGLFDSSWPLSPTDFLSRQRLCVDPRVLDRLTTLRSNPTPPSRRPSFLKS